MALLLRDAKAQGFNLAVSFISVGERAATPVRRFQPCSIASATAPRAELRVDRCPICVRLGRSSGLQRSTRGSRDRAPGHSILHKLPYFVMVAFLQRPNRKGKYHVQKHQAAWQNDAIAQAARAASRGRGLGRWRHLLFAGTTLNR